MQEAELAKEKMHGKLVYDRPVVVRLASEKYSIEASNNSSKAKGEASKSSLIGNFSGQTNRTAKIAAIKNKLKAMEEECHVTKKLKQADDIVSCNEPVENPPSVKR